MNRYDGYDSWKQWTKSPFGAFTAVDAAYFTAELKRAGIESCKNQRIFEIGFGNGTFAGYIRSRGGDYFGSEVSAALVDKAKLAGVNVFEHGIKQGLESSREGAFSAVVAFDVLEHLDISEIKAFLQDAHKLLCVGGILLARVPSGDSPFGRAVFHGDITHRCALGSSAVRQLASLVGFEVIDIGPPRFPILGLGLTRALRRGSVRLAQIVIAYIVNLVFHDGQPRVITANLVFVLRKPVA